MAVGSWVTRKARSLSIVALLCALLFLSGASPPSTRLSSRTVGYLSYWHFETISSVPLGSLTHIIWQGVEVTGATDPTLRIPNGYPWDQVSKLVKLAHAGGVKVLVSLGGPWNKPDLNEVWRSSQLRARLVDNLRDMAVSYDLDGIDVDNESSPDWLLYSTFITVLHHALAPIGKTVTMAGSASSADIGATAAQLLDFIGVMAYDMAGGAGYPYHSTIEDSIRAMRRWTDAGIARNKLLMGIPFYGRDAGSRFYPYSWIAATYNPSPGQNEVSGAEFRGGKLWWNGQDLVKRKVEYVINGGFGGIMVYELGTDIYDQRSLLTAVNKEMLRLAQSATRSAACGSRQAAPREATLASKRRSRRKAAAGATAVIPPSPRCSAGRRARAHRRPSALVN